MRTNKDYTYEVLNSYFLNTATMKINETYLNDLLDITAFNTKWIYDKMTTRRSKSTTIAFYSLIEWCNQELRLEHPGYYASNEQVKKWLNEYGNGYDSIKEIADFIEEYRNNEIFNA